MNDELHWEDDSNTHTHVEAALESVYEELAYLPVGGTAGKRGQRRTTRVKLSDIYVPLRSDASVDMGVRNHTAQWIRVKLAALAVGQCEDPQSPRVASYATNVDEDFLRLLLARAQQLVDEGRLPGLTIPKRPLISAPIWMDGDHKEVAQLEAGSAVNLYKRTVLLGPPGSGKSTLAKLLAVAHLRPQTRLRDGETPEALGLWRRVTLTPVFVELRNLASHHTFPSVGEAATVEHLLEYIRGVVSKGDESLAEFLIRQLYSGRGYLIMDGLDEVPIPHQVPDALELRRDQITAFIASVAGRFPTTKMLVTSRPAGYSGWTLPGFDALHLLPLSNTESRSLIMALYRGMGHPDDWCQQRSSALEPQLLAIPESVRSQPLFLSLLAQLYESTDASLPTQRGALLAEAIELLLGSWSLPRTGQKSLPDLLGCTGDQLLARLEIIALRSLEANTAPTFDEPAIPRSLILDELYELGSHVNPAEALDYVSQHAGILTSPAPRRYRFAHRLFQEYLAASAISKENNPGRCLIDYMSAGIPPWREVALLLADVLTNSRRVGEIWDMVADMTASNVIPLRLIAAEVLLDHPQMDRSTRIFSSILPLLQHAFIEALSVPALTAVERSRIGAALAWVGDPRPGVGLLPSGAPDFCWISIPGGTARLGTDANMRGPLVAFGPQWSYDREEPVHDVAIDSFDLSKYPVTVMQYQAFVRASDGFSDDRWWSSNGLDWRRHNSPAQGGPGVPENGPQAGITWYEAQAFCNWASYRHGEPIRMPTEAEWEWAARGPKAWLYPWGDQPRSEMANTLEGGIGRPCTVGCFESLTPWGANGPCDLIGNVWEWCSSAVESDLGSTGKAIFWGYPYRSDDGREDPAGGDTVLRATRGGYYGTSQAVCRSSLRGRDHPSARLERQGLRPVRGGKAS